LARGGGIAFLGGYGPGVGGLDGNRRDGLADRIFPLTKLISETARTGGGQALPKRIENAVHLCVDMQRIFARGGLWETPWMERVLPTIGAAVALCPERTVFTRFIPPQNADEAPGQWRHYYRRWAAATREMLDLSQLDLVPELAPYVPPAAIIDKPAYSAFYHSELGGFLEQRNVTTLIVSGSETDVCVLSTVLAAVNIGYRVVILEDGVCSSSDAGHDALMTMYRLRYTEQIDLLTADLLPEVWGDLSK
jgi:nicotinamidase-related amidase